MKRRKMAESKGKDNYNHVSDQKRQRQSQGKGKGLRLWLGLVAGGRGGGERPVPRAVFRAAAA